MRSLDGAMIPFRHAARTRQLELAYDETPGHGESMICTSNFATAGSHPQAVAISRGVPKGFTGRRYKALAPPWALLKQHNPTLFDQEYSKQLRDLDPREVYRDLGDGAVLLCWESFNIRCHRRMVAEWLEQALGVEIPELGHKRSESIPFSEQPGKPKKKSA